MPSLPAAMILMSSTLDLAASGSVDLGSPGYASSLAPAQFLPPAPAPYDEVCSVTVLQVWDLAAALSREATATPGAKPAKKRKKSKAIAGSTDVQMEAASSPGGAVQRMQKDSLW